MKTYLKSDVPEHNYPTAFTPYEHRDAGRFDVCRGCPLKLAVLALRSKEK